MNARAFSVLTDAGRHDDDGIKDKDKIIKMSWYFILAVDCGVSF